MAGGPEVPAGAAGVAARRLHATGLTEPSTTTPEEVVARHGAIQAQEYAHARWSIAQRSPGTTAGDVDDALAEGSLVRTHVLRPTWHLAARDDLRWLLAATAHRVRRLTAARRRELGLDDGVLASADEAVSSALRAGARLTRAQIAEVLDHAGIDRTGQRLPHILMHCELVGAICSGGLDGGAHTYALVDERVPRAPVAERAEAVAMLVRRYLEGHGLATAADIAWWASLTVREVAAALSDLEPAVEAVRVAGFDMWASAPVVDAVPRPRAVRFLQAYDELVVGYGESRFAGDARAGAARLGGRPGVPAALVIAGGRIAGHWRRTIGRDVVVIEVHAYGAAGPARMRALEEEAAALGRFVGRRPELRFSRL